MITVFFSILEALLSQIFQFVSNMISIMSLDRIFCSFLKLSEVEMYLDSNVFFDRAISPNFLRGTGQTEGPWEGLKIFV